VKSRSGAGRGGIFFAVKEGNFTAEDAEDGGGMLTTDYTDGMDIRFTTPRRSEAVQGAARFAGDPRGLVSRVKQAFASCQASWRGGPEIPDGTL